MPVTDLEAAALGCVAREAPCSAYAIRRHFRTSPSAHFSDSAGSVYPLVRRLSARGLLAARVVRLGERRTLAYVCTPRGRAELRRWLEVPLQPRGMVTVDPLRTRLLFLEQLSPARRARWFARAVEALERHRAVIRQRLEHDESRNDVFLELAHLNVLLQAEARLEWVRRVRARLARPRRAHPVRRNPP